MSLLPFDALYELASLFTESTKKYPARNWERGLSWSETQDSLLRHMAQWSNREEKDAESGFYHDVHILWNAIVLVTMRLRNIGTDDRREANELNTVSDNVPRHTAEGDISDPVVPVTATDNPTSVILTNYVSDMVRPDDDSAESGYGFTTVASPSSRKIVR